MIWIEEIDTSCQDCAFRGDWYMLEDLIWKKACKAYLPYKPRFLCLKCVAIRLGRGLKISDFSIVPCNRAIFLAYDMGVDDAHEHA